MKINCLVIDDEQLAREMMKAYIEKIPELQLIGLCSSAYEAQQNLEKHSIDLLFLDIQMPQQSGIDFLTQIKERKPQVIFTTAYPNYAIQGFELEATDYLLKPIAFGRFEQAVQKALKLHQTLQKAEQFDHQEKQKEQFIMVHSEHKHHKIMLQDIIYIESLKEYVRYHNKEGRIIELNSMKQLESQLPKDAFVRIHRSYIVALQHIQSYQNGHLILANSVELPVGKTYKKSILAQLFK